MTAEWEARRTAAAAVLADYQRAAGTADVAERAMWGARLADMLGYVLAAPASAEARKLTAIRQLLADFDWEFHDRQLALEEIDRIAEGPGQPAGLPPAQLSTVLAALEDAATLHTERAAAHCVACRDHPAGLCDEHFTDLDEADAYRQVAHEIGGQG